MNDLREHPDYKALVEQCQEDEEVRVQIRTSTPDSPRFYIAKKK